MTEPIDGAETVEDALKLIRFDAHGLAPAVAQDVETGEVLMLAWMSLDSLRASLAEGRAVYWSRSRQSLWRKGETSGHVQALEEVRIDCDADAILLRVRQTGPACHTLRRSCFYTALSDGAVRRLMEPMEVSDAAG